MTTKRALYRSRVPSLLNFRLNTHFQARARLPAGSLTSVHVLFFRSDAISASVASLHLVASGRAIASE
ncbi:hypothetical protein PHMEG_00022431 [Phytophthora megakarya]|uniref:Uncharacterized protein n=1 Tax=Phytophthora megakarya TaxID=4795 RepID=A0A225VJG7_9STRA|nr:hypothetical protein PHMEG_00022431 [Phytophthora megakarya]